VSDTAGITIVLGAPAEGQCPDNRPIVPQPMGSRVFTAANNNDFRTVSPLPRTNYLFHVFESN